MTILVSIIVCWFGVGITAVVLMGYTTWRKGEDITLGDAGPIIATLVLGPIICMILLREYMKKNPKKVLIPGSKSAKVWAALNKE